jgi:hypothetical protein
MEARAPVANEKAITPNIMRKHAKIFSVALRGVMSP